MWHQHLCMVGCVSSFVIFIDAAILLNIKLFDWSKYEFHGWHFQTKIELQKAFENEMIVHLLGGFCSFAYWFTAYLIALCPLKSIEKGGKLYGVTSTMLWKMMVRPYLLFIIFYNIMSFCYVMDYTGLISNDMQNLWTDGFSILRNFSTPGKIRHAVNINVLVFILVEIVTLTQIDPLLVRSFHRHL